LLYTLKQKNTKKTPNKFESVIKQQYLWQFNVMNPEDISETLGESHQLENLKFENFGKSQLQMVSPELTKASCKDIFFQFFKTIDMEK
jgi:hypothetical protein